METKIAAIKGARDLITRPPGAICAGLRLAQVSMANGLGLGRSWLFLPDAEGNFVAGEVDPSASVIGQAAELFAAVPAPVVLNGPDKLTSAPALRDFLALRGAGRIGLAPVVEAGKLAGLICQELPSETTRHLDLEMITEFAALLQDVLLNIRQDALRAETSARMTALLEAMPDMMFEVDSNGVYTGFVSGQSSRMVIRPEDFIGKNMSEVIPAEVAQLAHDAVRLILADGETRDISYDIDLPTGRRSYEVRGARKEPGRPGEQATVVFVIRDVTSQQALREELLRLSSVTRAMSNLVIIVDTEKRVTWINPAFEQRSGYSLNEIKGKVITDLTRCEESDPEQVQGVAEAIRDVKAFSGNMVNRDRYGNRYHVEFNILPLWSAKGDLQGFVSVETIVTELKEQQIALKSLAHTAEAAQNQLANAMNALADGVMLFDADLRLVTCNPAQRRAFPLVADHLVPGLKLSDLLQGMIETNYLEGPADPAQMRSHLDALLMAYQTESFVSEQQIKDGRWFRVVNKQTLDGGLVTVMIDVTARQRQMAELDSANERLWRALEERELTEQRLSSIMDATRVGTWMLDLGSRVMTSGRHWARIIGFEGSLVLQHAEFLEMVHPEDRHLLESDTPQNSALSPDMFEHEFRMFHKDGHWVWVLSRGRITRRDDLGRPLVLDGVDIDISELKRLEMEVRQNDALLKSALESNVAAVAIYDSNDILLYCNPEAERMLQLKPGLLYGRQVDGPFWTMERLNGDRMPIEDGPCNMARRAGALLRDLRYAIRWNDGRRQVLNCNATPFRSGNGQMHTAVSFWDSTEELAITERLQEALTHAEAMSRSKSIFLANMSHEIRTPLNGVLGLAEVLSMQIKDPEHSRMIATIRRSGETLLSVLNTILDMSKIEAGKIELEKMPLRLIDILQQLEAVYSVLAEEKGIDLEVITSAGADLTRIGDPHRIQQILGNLLSNAIKFSSTGGVTLTVACRPGKPVVFMVADTGIGMTPDQCSRVFSSFEQADESVSRRFGGTGLGLSIVRELVYLIGGTISLNSELGVGTEVQVSLPLPLVDEPSG